MANLNKSTPPGYWRDVKKDENGFIKRVTFNPNSQIRAHQEVFKKKFGKVEKTSIKKSLTPHIQSGNLFYVKMDISDAFGSITTKMVENQIPNRCIVWDGGVEKYFHKEGGLIQGSLVSPLIFNAFGNETFDKDIKKLCGKKGIKYTRFVDDILFSSRKHIPKRMRNKLRRLIRKYGLILNESKDVCLYTENNPLEVLGTRIHKGFISATDAFESRLVDMENDDPEWVALRSRSISGMKAWKKYIENINTLSPRYPEFYSEEK